MNLVIRADASAEIGTGHVLRCLALAQRAQEEGGAVLFIAREIVPGLVSRLDAEGMCLERLPESIAAGSMADARETAERARAMGAEWVVVDGYHFGEEYQRAIKSAGLHLLYVEDGEHSEREPVDCYAADLVLNQNVHAEEAYYAGKVAPERLLLRTEHALLRREFRRQTPPPKRFVPGAPRVLVTLGGADKDNVTLRVIEALRQVALSGVEARVLVGAANPHRESLEAAVADTPGLQLLANVTDMPEQLAWADLAIAAAGSTCWELAYMGVPAIVVVLADNQAGIAAGLERSGAALKAGLAGELTPEELAGIVSRLVGSPEARAQMSERARALVDGRGVDRILARMHMVTRDKAAVA